MAESFGRVRIASLEMLNFRSFEKWSGEFHPNFNFVVGANGSGKTSLLESVHFLARARTFTNSQSFDLQRRGESSFQVVGKIEDRDALVHQVGHLYQRGGSVLKLDGERQTSRKALALIGPLSVISPSSTNLVRGGPSLRRQFLDQYLFHVEHKFGSIWSSYRKALSQHNACLVKGQTSQLSVWRAELVQLGIELDRYRKKASAELFTATCESLLKLQKPWQVELEYRQGWPEENSLDTAIESSLENDLRRKTTQRGPHRAELKIRVDGRPDEQISNGEAKLLALAMILARHSLLREKLGCSAPIIVDDLSAEVDKVNSDNIIAYISSLDCQVFMSQLEEFHYEIPPSNLSVFHVEH